jgi:PIN domain nuclease of toxin-antitoxin system
MSPSRLLLDSHIVLWSLSGEGLSARARDLMGTADSLYCSAASVWELTLKARAGKLELPKGWLDAVVASGIELMDITPEHALAVAVVDLPHGDPFDRLLLAQAMTEQVGLLTADKTLLETDYPFVVKA